MSRSRGSIELLEFRLGEIASTPGIGAKKLEKLVLAVDRARNAIERDVPAGRCHAERSTGDKDNEEKIKSSFEPWQIAQFFETPRRLGVLGHTADEEGHKILRSELEESEKVRQDARNLMLFEWARELLLGEGGP